VPVALQYEVPQTPAKQYTTCDGVTAYMSVVLFAHQLSSWHTPPIGCGFTHVRG
jgi:hypothetical protein